MTSVKGWHTGRVWFMTLSASLRIVVVCFSLLSCIPVALVAQRYHVTSDTLGREFDPGKQDFSH